MTKLPSSNNDFSFVENKPARVFWLFLLIHQFLEFLNKVAHDRIIHMSQVKVNTPIQQCTVFYGFFFEMDVFFSVHYNWEPLEVIKSRIECNHCSLGVLLIFKKSLMLVNHTLPPPQCHGLAGECAGHSTSQCPSWSIWKCFCT